MESQIESLLNGDQNVDETVSSMAEAINKSIPEYVGALLSVFPEARATVESQIESLLNGDQNVDETVSSMAEAINKSIEEYNLVNN